VMAPAHLRRREIQRDALLTTHPERGQHVRDA
jgi:hypothetical protein